MVAVPPLASAPWSSQGMQLGRRTILVLNLDAKSISDPFYCCCRFSLQQLQCWGSQIRITRISLCFHIFFTPQLASFQSIYWNICCITLNPSCPVSSPCQSDSPHSQSYQSGYGRLDYPVAGLQHLTFPGLVSLWSQGLHLPAAWIDRCLKLYEKANTSM